MELWPKNLRVHVLYFFLINQSIIYVSQKKKKTKFHEEILWILGVILSLLFLFFIFLI